VYVIISRDVSCGEPETLSFPNASLYSYKARMLDIFKDDVITVEACRLRWAKGVYTREKNRVLLKHFSEQKKNMWVIKVS
jgi:hypothetical protein